MELPLITLVLALLLVLVGLLQPLAAFLRLPHTIVLAAVGVTIAIAATILADYEAGTPVGAMVHRLLHLPITSEAFLYIFLPILIFQASLTMEPRRLLEDAAPIFLLAVVAVLVTTFAVGFALWPIAGVSVVVCLLLGSIVATTDPAAVVAVFREIGAPGRLSRLVEGESVLNDAAAIVLFAILLEMILVGGEPDLAAGTVSFVVSFAGGIAAGLVGTRLVIALTVILRKYRLAQITLTLALPYLLFIPAQLYLQVSGVVAVVTAGLMMSAHGRGRFPPETWTFLNDVWEQLAFWVSSLVFVLAALFVPTLLVGVNAWDILLVLAVVVAAAAARALVLYGLLPLLTLAKLAQPVSHRYRLVILWGGLRGAVTLALALAITENSALPTEIQRFVAICATGFVLFTLFVNGTTLRPIIRLLGLTRLSPLDSILRENVLALARTKAQDAIKVAADRFRIAPEVAQQALAPYEQRLAETAETTSRETEIDDRDRITIALVGIAHQEREIVLEHFRGRLISQKIAQLLVDDIDAIIDRARQGRVEYNRAARRRLEFDWGFRIANYLHRALGIEGPVSRRWGDRFEVLLVTGFVLGELRAFVDQRLSIIFGPRVAEIIGEIVDQRIEATSVALDALRLQYPEYTAALKRRFLERFALRVESQEHDHLLSEGLIGPELHRVLEQETSRARDAVELRPALDLSLHVADLIRTFPRFKDFDDSQVAEVAARLKPRFAIPGERLIRKGERGDAMYFIASGAVEVAVGSRRIRLGRGDFFGEMALLSGGRRNADVTALSFCRLLSLSAKDFLALMKKYPQWRRVLRDITSERENSNRNGATVAPSAKPSEAATAGAKAESGTTEPAEP